MAKSPPQMIALSIFCATKDKAIITMKSKKIKPFIALVENIKFHEEGEIVIFRRVAETIFPDDTETEKNDTYTTFVKNVKDADLYK